MVSVSPDGEPLEADLLQGKREHDAHPGRTEAALQIGDLRADLPGDLVDRALRDLGDSATGDLVAKMPDLGLEHGGQISQVEVAAMGFYSTDPLQILDTAVVGATK